MSERKWTPGPWAVQYKGGETQLVMGDGDVHMCDMHYYPWVPDNDADWHLISAAPDLYEALEALIDEYEMQTHGPVIHSVSQARAAIAKARGEV